LSAFSAIATARLRCSAACATSAPDTPFDISTGRTTSSLTASRKCSRSFSARSCATCSSDFALEIQLRAPGSRFDQNIEGAFANACDSFGNLLGLAGEAALGARELGQALGGASFIFFGGDHFRLRCGLRGGRRDALLQICDQTVFVRRRNSLQRGRLCKIDTHVVRVPPV
jgi:hypothetical protein